MRKRVVFFGQVENMFFKINNLKVKKKKPKRPPQKKKHQKKKRYEKDDIYTYSSPMRRIFLKKKKS